MGRGLVYKGLKPVHWCMHCKTALAQAEVEYEDQRTPSVYVKFPLTSAASGARRRRSAGAAPSLVIWTTTPWTLAGQPRHRRASRQETTPRSRWAARCYVVARALAAAAGLARRAPAASATPLASMPGAELAGHGSRHPWIARDGTVAAADFVAMDAGTGLVHIAPGHGEEDYDLGRRSGSGSTTRSTTTGASSPRSSTSPG